MVEISDAAALVDRVADSSERISDQEDWTSVGGPPCGTNFDMTVWERSMVNASGDIGAAQGVDAQVNLIRSVEYLLDARVKGDFVECGVYLGASIVLIAKTLLKHGITDRRIWLYDTFEGMPEPTEKDIWWDGTSAIKIWEDKAKIGVVGSDHVYGPIERVIINCRASGYPMENFVFVKGLVENTIPRQVPEKIALLRLDTDYYDSTKHELDHLYPRLAKGGVLIVDDYGANTGARFAVDEYFGEYGSSPFLARVDASVRFAISLGLADTVGSRLRAIASLLRFHRPPPQTFVTENGAEGDVSATPDWGRVGGPPSGHNFDMTLWEREMLMASDAVGIAQGPEAQVNLMRAIDYVIDAKIAGDFVECGVYRGGSIFLIAMTLLKHKVANRHIWLYDTFEGMPRPTDKDIWWNGTCLTDHWDMVPLMEGVGPRPVDPERGGNASRRIWFYDTFEGKPSPAEEEDVWWNRTPATNDWVHAPKISAIGSDNVYGPIERVRENCRSMGYPMRKFLFVKGLVEDTIPAQMPKKISLLRLDTTYYTSTKHELEHLYPRLSKGGILIIDDYGANTGAKRAVDEYFAKHGPAPFLSRVDASVRIAVKIYD